MRKHILELHRFSPNLSRAEIAKKIGCSWAYVYYCLKPAYRTRFHRLRNQRRKDKKEQLIREAGGQCVKCGYNKSLAALEFHHLNPKKKELTLGKRMDAKLELLRKEAKKCILVCANCHAETHAL